MWKHVGGVLIMTHDMFWRLLSPPRQFVGTSSQTELLQFEALLLSPGQLFDPRPNLPKRIQKRK